MLPIGHTTQAETFRPGLVLAPSRLGKRDAEEKKKYAKFYRVYSDFKSIRDSFLAEIRKLQQSARLLVTSRHISSIEKVFGEAPRVEIFASDQDIRKYIECRIKRESQLVRYVRAAPDLQEAIASTVVRKAKGM